MELKMSACGENWFLFSVSQRHSIRAISRRNMCSCLTYMGSCLPNGGVLRNKRFNIVIEFWFTILHNRSSNSPS